MIYDRATLDAIIEFIEGGSFLSPDSPDAIFANALVKAIKREMVSKTEPLPNPETLRTPQHELSRVKHLTDLLRGLPDNIGVMCQVVGAEQPGGGAWNMCCKVSIVGGCVLLQAWHPKMPKLPAFGESKKYKKRNSYNSEVFTLVNINEDSVHLNSTTGKDLTISLDDFMNNYTKSQR